MKIGIIAHLKHPIAKPFMGGLEAFTYEVAKLLITRGHDVTLFASESSDQSLNVHSIMSDSDYDRETLSRFHSHNLSEDFISTHHAYLELMQEIDDSGFDVIFNNSLNYVPITMASTCITPMVTVLHTPPIYEMKRATARERKSGKITYVSVSKSNMDAWKPFVNNCQVISNGIDLDKWKFCKSNEGKYVIWFGRIHPDKGTHIAIQAAKLAGKKIKIAGSIADRHYYEDYVKPLLDDDAEWVRNCDHDQLNELIGNAEVSVITPCWDEPFGLVVAESLACGTPIAGISRGALPTIVKNDTGVLTPSSDPSEIAKCIIKASKLDRASCRLSAEEQLCQIEMIKCYENLFKSVIDHNSIKHAV